MLLLLALSWDDSSDRLIANDCAGKNVGWKLDEAGRRHGDLLSRTKWGGKGIRRGDDVGEMVSRGG